jgi:hypothetical protein
MAFDASKIGQHVAAMMEALEGDYGENSEIGNICTIAEIATPGEEEGTYRVDIRVRHTGTPAAGVGLCRMGERSLTRQLGG